MTAKQKRNTRTESIALSYNKATTADDYVKVALDMANSAYLGGKAWNDSCRQAGETILSLGKRVTVRQARDATLVGLTAMRVHV